MQDFSTYDLIIDARSEREYQEDHIPGAINLPVVDNDQYAEVGIQHKHDAHQAYLIGVTHSYRNIADDIGRVISNYPRKAKILVYCFRGGKRSRLWFDALDTIGYKVDRLPGGWKAYRRWVNEQLTEIPKQFNFNVLSGPTGCGKTRLLNALKECGAQVLDLEDLAKHRGSLIGAIPGVEQPNQKYFDSLILEQLMKFNSDEPVWLEAESKKIGERQIPQALFDKMHAGTPYKVKAPMSERVKLWREDYRHFEENPNQLINQLIHLKPFVGGDEFETWKALADKQNMPKLFERLMTAHYDPAYRRSTLRHFPTIDASKLINLSSLAKDELTKVASTLIGEQKQGHE
jgi:tRNA 2-selenouridine synthase